jgi:integrase/recombinase XerD
MLKRRYIVRFVPMLHHTLFLIETTRREDNPLDMIDSVHISEQLPSTLHDQEIEKLLESIDTTDLLGIRDFAIFEMIYSCGLRVSELTSLEMKDINVTTKSVRVIGKGDKERQIPIGDYALEALKTYLEVARPKFVGPSSKEKTLFVGRRGKALNRASVWKRFKEYARKANVEAKVHTLRHTYATHLLRGGADLRSVQLLLGHSDIRTTQIYTHTETEELLQAFRTFHPDGESEKV